MAILDDADGAETRESPRDANDAIVVDAMSEGATPTARGGADARDDDGDDDETSTRKLLPNDAATTTSDAKTTTTRERAEDDLERELDAVVDGGRDDAGASGDGDEESQRAAPEDAFDRYLQPKFWMTLGDVKIFVSLWTIYVWGVMWTLLVVLGPFVGGGGVIYFFFWVLTVTIFLSCLFAFGYGTMIAHELSHVYACRRFGGRVDEDKGIILWPFGALAFLHLDGLTLSQELAVTLAGPISHAPMLALLWLLSLDAFDDFASLCLYLAFLNFALLVWHFLPCYPMDGSRVLACALLLTRRVRVETAAWVVVVTSYACSIAYIYLSLTGHFSITAYFALQNLDWVFGVFCLVATSHVLFLLRNGRVRDHPTFSRYEIVYDAYHAFDDVSRPEVFL